MRFAPQRRDTFSPEEKPIAGELDRGAEEYGKSLHPISSIC